MNVYVVVVVGEECDDYLLQNDARKNPQTHHIDIHEKRTNCIVEEGLGI